MSTVTYIEHSGFLVETEEYALLFDYYKGCIPKSDKPLFIFSSHRHHDHFVPAIMQIPCVKTILSNDIRVRPNENTVKLGANKTFETNGLKIRTLPSTDEGVAFIVDTGREIIYHAGDLNDWYWEGEPDEENRKMSEKYRRVISEGFGGIRDVDMAFIPVDSRLGRFFDRGARYFIENVNAKHIFPMHFWGDYSCVEKFCAAHKNAHLISRAPQSFEID